VNTFITRQEIASLIGHPITVDIVRKNERRWGLAEYKIALNQRLVIYRRKEIIVLLVRLGLVRDAATATTSTTAN